MHTDQSKFKVFTVIKAASPGVSVCIVMLITFNSGDEKEEYTLV